MSELSGPLASLRESARRAVAALPCAGSVTVAVDARNYTRFAAGRITQNTTNESFGVSVALARREERGWRLLRRSFGDGDPAALVASLLPELDRAAVNGEFKGFAPPLPAPPVTTAHPSVERSGLEEKARIVRRLLDEAAGLTVGGILETGVETSATVNSDGVDREETLTSVHADVKYENAEGGTASFQWAGRDLDRLPLAPLSADAIARCRANVGKTPLPDGDYPLLLTPSAVSEFLYFLAHLGFGGREYKQKRSFVHGRMGQRVIDNERITIVDDPHHPDTLTSAYDDEGMPKRPLVLIERGIARAVAHNTLTADTLEGSTGHAIGLMAYPMLLRMAPGDVSWETLLAEEGRALLVSRLHYPTIDDPDKVILKGSTKDGTFLVERGKLSAARDLEFQVEIPALFSAMTRLTDRLHALPQGSLASSLPGLNLVPGARVDSVLVRDGRFTLR